MRVDADNGGTSEAFDAADEERGDPCVRVEQLEPLALDQREYRSSDLPQPPRGVGGQRHAEDTHALALEHIGKRPAARKQCHLVAHPPQTADELHDMCLRTARVHAVGQH